jgi:hypothetical protein
MVVSRPSLSGLGRNDSHKIFKLMKHRFVIQAMEPSMPFLIRYLKKKSKLDPIWKSGPITNYTAQDGRLCNCSVI